MAELLDSKVQAYLDQIKELARKLNFYIHGDGVMQTQAGGVESIKALNRRLSSTGYFHPMKEVNRYRDAVDAALPQDSVLWVKSDPDPTLNGLYQVQADASLKAMDYQSLTGLVDQEGRKLIVHSRPVKNDATRVDFFKIQVPSNQTQTIWLDCEVKSYLFTEMKGAVDKASFVIRRAPDVGFVINRVNTGTHPGEGLMTANMPLLKVDTKIVNAGTSSELTLVTLYLEYNGSNGVSTFSLKDSSNQAYLA